MKILLDTNALLWLLSDDTRLVRPARQKIENAQEIVVSEASLWEISIKISIGKLKPVPKLFSTINDLGFRRISLEDEHLLRYEKLPLLHRDPFDRMLVAQAKAEGLALLTSDIFLKNYGVRVINAS